jgi:hypothetical protein
MNKDVERDRQFYMQITAALLRRLGGHTVIRPSEFEADAGGVKHRLAPDGSGIEIMVAEHGNG